MTRFKDVCKTFDEKDAPSSHHMLQLCRRLGAQKMLGVHDSPHGGLTAFPRLELVPGLLADDVRTALSKLKKARKLLDDCRSKY